jgi:gamma-glutamylcyclotransferase (GGCT)/AIG2-like uncharacterized protein YtfP
MAEPLPYAAYGSNLNPPRMLARCPGAVALGRTLLPGWRLELRRYATIAPDPAAAVPLGLWRITPAHLAALDRAEGVAYGAYRRIRLLLPEGGEAWCYEELNPRPGPPHADYVAHLRHGYRAFGLDEAVLEAVVTAAGFRA